MGSLSNSNYAQTDEEEELALALALSASLADGGASSSAPSHQPTPSPHRPAAPPSHTKPTLRHPIHPIPTPHYPTSSSTASQPPPSYPQPHHPYLQPQPPYPQPQPQPPYRQPHLPHPQPPQSRLPYPQPHHPAPPPPQPSTYPSPPPSQPKPSFSPLSFLPQLLNPSSGTCSGCQKDIYGAYITALGRKYHPACLKCAGCGEAINSDGNLEFATHTDGKVYHIDCHRLSCHPSCTVCGNFIPARPDGRIEFSVTPFWRDKYCPHHQQENVPKCCSCSRLQPHDAGLEYEQLQDGRHLCLSCIGSMVVDTREAQPLYQEVLEFYKKLGMRHPAQPPLILVDSSALNDFSNREGRERTDGPVFHVRGLCLSEMYMSIPSIMRTVGGGFARVNSQATAVQRAECVVTAILVIYGMPRLLTGAIVAHELMHAWLRMKGVVGLDLQVEEGLCQLMALLWLDCAREQLENSQGGDREAEVKLGACFGYHIREDPSQVYGDGFRMAFECYQKLGLKTTVDAVLATGRFPAV